MLLFPVVLVAAFIAKKTKKERIVRSLLPIGFFLLIIIVRICNIGTYALSGTNSENVVTGFDFRLALSFAFEQAGFLLGINGGPAFFTGVTAAEMPESFLAVVALMDVFLIVYAILAIFVERHENRIKAIKATVLCLFFIAMCIGSSSVTIRLEIRWIYASFTGLLILIAAVWSGKEKQFKRAQRVLWYVMAFCLCGYFVTDSLVETKYREYWGNIFHLTVKERADSFEDATWRKYGKDFFTNDMEVVLVNSSQTQWEDELSYIQRWLKTRGENDMQGKIKLVKNLQELKENYDENAVYLVREGNSYTDISDYFRILDSSDVNIISGIDDDQWMYQEAELEIYAKDEGYCLLQFYSPITVDDSWADRTGRIYVNGEVAKEFVMNSQALQVELHIPPNEKSILRIENDWTDPALIRNGREMCFTVVILENR